MRAYCLYTLATFLSILAVPNNAIFCTCSILISSFSFLTWFSNSTDIAPNAPITTGISNNFFIPHIRIISSLNSCYFSIFSCSLLLTLESPGIATSIIFTSFPFLINYHNVRSSCFYYVVTLAVKIPQDFVYTILYYPFWLMFVPFTCFLQIYLFT